MSLVKIFKETAVPGTLEANAIYLVGPAGNASLLEIYVVDSAGSAVRKTMGPSDVQALIDASVSGINGTEIVADIAERDALTLTANAMVLVEDASGDAGVNSGAALYTYKHATTSFTRIAEYESLDISLTWSAIAGRPTSSPSAIDAAVAATHTHSNATELDKIGEDGDGNPTYSGENFAMVGTQNW